jgi:DNA-binding NarL/FixJ family response regulator
MAARLAGLPDATRLGLGLVAAAGEPSWMLLRAAGVEPAMLEPALTTEVLESTASTVRFSHPLLASTYYGRMTPTRRKAIHEVLAGLLTEPVERARHLAIVTDTPSGEIAATIDAAAETASSRGAVAAAAELREHALRLTPPNADDDRHRRTVALAHACLANAEAGRARDLARVLAEHAPAGPRRAEALLLQYELGGAEKRSSIVLLREALGEPDIDPALRVRIHQRLGWDLRFVEDVAAAAPHAEAALAAAEELGQYEVLAPALAVAVVSRLHSGRPDAAELIERVYAVIPLLDDLTVRFDVVSLVTAVVATRDLDRHRGVLQPLCDELSDRAEWRAAHALWGLAIVECHAGRFVLASELATRAGELESLYGQDSSVSISFRYLDALVAAHLGDLGAAATVATHAIDLARERSPIWIPWCENVAGVTSLWSGDVAGACAHFLAAEHANDSNGSRDPGVALWRPHLAEAFIARGRIDEAVALLDRWEGDATRLGRCWVLAEVRRCRGLVAAADGDLDTAETLLEQAAAEHLVTSDPFDRARAILDLGIVRRRARRKRSSREAIEQSIALFDECGAEGWAARARAELGTLSGRTRQEGLSAAEQRVAVLAADGRTNREIATELYLSERTVQTHLTHAYAKLGVRSRTELARSFAASS